MLPVAAIGAGAGAPQQHVLEAWAREQAALAARVVCRDDADWLLGPGGWAGHLRLVGGLDISFFPPTLPSSPAGTADNSSNAAGREASSSDNAHALETECAGAPALCTREQRAQAAGRQAAAPPPAAATESNDRAVASLAVLSFPGLEVAHVELMEVPALGAPYLPGFLGFREVPAYLELLRRAAARGVHPQLLLVDGFGVLHPRRCGSASHLGVLSGLPTVGVAKSLLHLEGLPGEKEVRAVVAAAAGALQVAAPPAPAAAAAAAAAPSTAAALPAAVLPPAAAPSQASNVRSLPCGGFWLPLMGAGGEELGAALCAGSGACSSSTNSSDAPSCPTSRRPVFVSVGHRIGLASAVAIVQRCCRHRVAEPIRQADLLSRAEVRRLQQAGQATTGKCVPLVSETAGRASLPGY